MHNYFMIDVDAELMRQDRERAAAADARAALACPSMGIKGWLTRFTRSHETLPAVASPNTPVGALLELPRVPRPVAC